MQALATTTSPHRHLRLMSNNDSRRDTPTDAAPPLEDEITTNPHASEAPVAPRTALRPPAPPSDEELGASQLANQKPPAWWADSFIGQELGRFADDARAIREGRDRQHREQMGKLHELAADNGLIRGELRAFRQAVNETKVDHDRQLADLRAEVAALRNRMDADRAEFERKFAEQQASVDAVNEVIAELDKARRDAESTKTPEPTPD